MSFKKQDLLNISELSALYIDENELLNLENDLNNMLEMIEDLNNFNADNIEPLEHPLEVIQTFREDIVTEENNREEFLKNAPNSEDYYFLVPKVIE